MGTPTGNGLVEIFGEKTKERGFFCMKLVGYIIEDEETFQTPLDYYDQQFAQARSGNCPYKDKCPIYARTIAKHGKKPVQLYLDFK